MGGNIGFRFSFFVGVFGVMCPPFLGLIFRHKWHRPMAGAEGIKSLCGYDDVGGEGEKEVEVKGGGGVEVTNKKDISSHKMMHPCVICSCPTKKKCGRCKSAYYCSGDCQIFDWRHGHKDKCQPYNRSRSTELAMPSHVKVSNQEENGRDANANPAETSTNSFKSVPNFKDMPAANGSHVSRSRSSKYLPAKADDIKTQTAPANNVLSHPSALELDDKDNNGAPSTLSGTGVTLESIKQRIAKSGIRSMEFSGPDHNAKHASKSSTGKVADLFKTSTPHKQHTRGYGTEKLAKYEGLFPYELFVKLYNGKEVEFRPCGFINCGNSCYANVVLQCLASTPPLTSYFLQGYHSNSCEKRDWCFTCELERLMLKAKDGATVLSPIRIISHLQNIGSHLINGRQEDAHEFLRYAIDAMQSISLTEAGVKECGSLEEGTTLVGLTFGGIIRSKIECMGCGGKSAHQERMMDLTVEIDGDVGTLEEALKQYTCVEILDGDNMYRCDRCKSYVKAKKKLKVMEAPNVLTIALKRYRLGKFGKLNKMVQFPETLNLGPYICGTSDTSPIYGLYGVIVHLDAMNDAFSGHYVCYVKNTKNKWFMLNDSVVKNVDIEEVLTKDAYMLLYARYSPRAPGLIRSSLIPLDPRDSRGVSTSEDPPNDDAFQECTRRTNSDYVSSSANSSFSSGSGSCYDADNSNIDFASPDEHLGSGTTGAFSNNYGSSSGSDTSLSSSSPSQLSFEALLARRCDRFSNQGCDFKTRV